MLNMEEARFLRNVGNNVPNNTASHRRRSQSKTHVCFVTTELLSLVKLICFQNSNIISKALPSKAQ